MVLFHRDRCDCNDVPVVQGAQEPSLESDSAVVDNVPMCFPTAAAAVLVAGPEMDTCVTAAVVAAAAEKEMPSSGQLQMNWSLGVR